MPTPRTPRRTPNRGSAKQSQFKEIKPLDLGEPLGPHDSATVREKVRKWQQLGGGVVIAPDVGASSDEGEKKSPPGSKLKESKQATNKSPVASKGPPTPKGKATPEPEKKTRSPTKTKITPRSTPRTTPRTTPKKRVVSDAHWRRNRSPPPSSSAPSSTHATPTRRKDVLQKYEEAKEKAARTSGVKDSDGIAVYPGPLRVPEPLKAASSVWSSDVGSSAGEGEKSSTQKPTPKRTLRPNYCVNDDKHRIGSPRRKTQSPDLPRTSSPRKKPPSPKPADPPPEPAAAKAEPVRRSEIRPHNLLSGNIISQVIDESKKMFSMRLPESSAPSPPAPQPPQGPSLPHGSKVEAWLSSTADPFVDDNESTVSMPAPLKSSSTKSSLPRKDYSDGEREEESTKKRPSPSSGLDKKKQQAKPSKGKYDYSDGSDSDETYKMKSTSQVRESKSDISVENTSESQPSTLKRGRATRSRGQLSASEEAERMSMLRESVEEALQGSSLDRPISSDGSEVSAVDRPPPLMLKRPFPSTGGHRLSTIASVDTLTSSTNTNSTAKEAPNNPITQSELSQLDDDAVSESEKRDKFDPQSLPGPTQPLKRRLTKHADLMSVLSLPGGRSRSIRSARSIRTNRSRLANATVSDIMRELASDEVKYMRELRTLVGGVIPVLLTSILSKTDSAVAAGLFRRSADPSDQENFTRPIINMGVSLEKLKALHKRLPLNNTEALLSWAVSAQKVYADYLSAWRLGFQDVIVNLAPPDPEEALKAETQSLCAGMAQDENGDVINGDGERVDVAFLLKRPLVRLKYLSKTFKGLNYVQPSPKAEEIAHTYQSLVTDARRRANEERSRLEDDAAASIDSTRARDIHTLAILKNVEVNQTRRVRARDFFDLSLLHSTGQQIDCRAELLLRDNPPGEAPGGDLFICEVDEADRWLLFPPIDCTYISARNGDGEGEIVLMVRASAGNSTEWYELLSFTTDDEQIGFEWVQMIGLNPVPPKINRSLSFINRAKERREKLALARQGQDGDAILIHDYDPSEIDVPIGEKATVVGEDLQHGRDPVNHNHAAASPSTPSRTLRLDTTQSLNEVMDSASSVSPSLKRSKAKRRSKYDFASPTSPASSGIQTPDRESSPRPPSPLLSRVGDQRGRDRTPSPTTPTSGSKQQKRPIASLVQPHGRRSLSPVPSLEFPTIPKLRKGSPKNSPPASPKSVPLPDSPVSKKSENKLEQTPVGKGKKSLDKGEKSTTSGDEQALGEDAPMPPLHRTPSPASSKQLKSPIISPPAPPYSRHRRTSSPLKHEYAPSTASESSGSDTSSIQRYDVDSSSETSDEELEDEDIPTPLPPITNRLSKRIPRPASADDTQPTAEAGSRPGSAYQSPPKSIHSSPERASKTVASVFYWHDKGSWEPLHLNECNIIVTPGLIEAFEMGPNHSRPAGQENGSAPDSTEVSRRPLVALELTPLVPIRRGTAIDISIRSPPTAQSKVSSGSNVMFRSRNPDDCDKLYGLINHSRINNPTYIALQNAVPYSSQPNGLSRHNSTRSNKGGGWFSWYGGFSKSSYRASTAPPASLAGGTESSVGTMSSAFSALKRFGAGSKMFSIARSTLTSRNGSRDNTSLYTTSTGSGSGQRFPSTNPETAHIAAEGGIGLTNAKIRLYTRESAAKWRDLGAARLTILPADTAPSNTPPNFPDDQEPSGTSSPSFGSNADTAGPPRTPPSSGKSGARVKDEKRILIRSKLSGETLVDACLGESCFERVARTGIAVSIWEEYDGIAKEGGVVGGCFKVYMIQMKSEAEAAYTFGLVGKLRY